MAACGSMAGAFRVEPKTPRSIIPWQVSRQLFASAGSRRSMTSCVRGSNTVGMAMLSSPFGFMMRSRAVVGLEIAEQVGEILVRHAKEAGEHFGLKRWLDAEFKIGRSWAGEPPNTEPPAPPAPLVPEPAAMELTVPIEPDSNPPSEPGPDDTLDEPKPDIRADRDELAALLEEADRDGVAMMIMVASAMMIMVASAMMIMMASAMMLRISATKI